ncbi:MAG TPA: sigma-70 family RNA polymerase sigma factor [Pyrinomonadaceae bacterium]|nr:sigma-70 family RNA polymerase sigma factor [Pyrinomonadaceae bacterium]
MIKPRPLSSAKTHEDLFIQRYDQLLAWALQLTEGDRAQAKDLVQDAFVQFTFRQPDLNSIENLEGYLRGILRHLHLSQLRRAARASKVLHSAIDFEAAEVVLRTIDVRGQTQIQDELRSICHYACVRKESSSSGSVLILRFFHGYYPTEAARIMRTSRQVVDNSLRSARREARVYLEDPNFLTFMAKGAETVPRPQSFDRTPTDFFNELRLTIFSSRKGACLSDEQLQELYHSAATTGLETRLLAHIVSCERCLAEVNKILGLPPLSDRNPPDMLGPDTSAKGGFGADVKGAKMNAIDASKYLDDCRRRGRVIYEHRPEALEFSVNGFPLSSCVVDSERNEQTFTVNIEEKISFVEVFGDHGIRLALFEVEPPPDGPATHSQKVEFSDGRSLELSLNFGSPWPSLHSLYRDPLLGDVPAIDTGAIEESASDNGLEIQERKIRPAVSPITRLWRELLKPGLWLRPGMVTLLVALVLIAGVLFVTLRREPAPSASAMALLSQAATAEDAVEARTDQVLHRTISLEEKRLTGELIARHKIEVWHSAGRGVSARRLYDARGALIAGDWRRSDGVQTLYHHGSRPKLQLAPGRDGDDARLTFDNVWRVLPSAKEFAALIKDPEAAKLREQLDQYEIDYKSSTIDGSSGLLSATLVLDTDLRAIGQTLVVRQEAETRLYRFTEASYERHAPATVLPSVFEPETELLPEAIKDEGGRMNVDTLALSPVPIRPSPVLATAELEVEVLQLLKQAGADLGEQVDVTRTPSGTLQVNGIVETPERKTEILRALQPVISNPAARVEINTVAEALAKQRRTSPAPSVVTVEPSAATADRIPFDDDLRNYFASRGVATGQLDEQVRQYASQSLTQSRQALMYAGALKRLSARFSAQDLQALDKEARAKWLLMIRERALSLQQETAALRQRLGPIFFPSFSSSDVSEGNDLASDEDLIKAIGRLYDQCAANDRVVRAAFTTSPETARAATMRSGQFGRMLRNTELLALQVQNATRD